MPFQDTFLLISKDQFCLCPQEAGDSDAQIFNEAVQFTKYESAQPGH